MSCKKTRAVLDESSTSLAEERNASKSPLSDADAKALIASVDTILVAKGKAARTLSRAECTLDDLRGPTGGFRAPIVRKGKTLLVGFSEELLRKFIK